LQEYEGKPANFHPADFRGVTMRFDKEYIVITDIGSTTTKAILLDNREQIPRLLGITQAPTTVEAPANDVRSGIYSALRLLEKQTGIKLLKSPDAANLAFEDNVSYLTTSSAGGGLQILVIGLTMFDSASSGKRCAYGAGGVILDTFAINDKRQAMEQMMAMRNLHPDMILLCGGTDGGAISGVLRMAEIVRIANPAPKFDAQSKIPALYAGNKDAAPIIQKLISQAFDLHILPNLRPSLEAENLQPTQDKIQQLFMENVMEQAPGYAEVKPSVSAPIIPTPEGVHKALALIAEKEQRNIFAFDIGGATTDVFSFINTHFQRTVSANLGMSYSAWNVLHEAGLENILRWLPKRTDPAAVRDYIANKCLHPTSNPFTAFHYRVEHALAKEALSMALEQHRQMHYNGSKLGYLDKLKQDKVEKFELQFEYQREDEKHRFGESDIDVLIGAGGIFAHSQNRSQCMMLLIDSFRPKGITEIWIDSRFISPHLGVLSSNDADASRHLLASDCLEKLAVHIAPAFYPREKKALISLEISTAKGNQTLVVLPDSFYFLPEGTKTISITLLNKTKLNTGLDLQNIKTTLPVIIDTRLEASEHPDKVEQALQLYPEVTTSSFTPENETQTPLGVKGNWIRKIELPYSGDINFSVGDRVQPENVVAVNRFNPPRLYIVNGFANFPDITPQQISEALIVKKGDILDFDQNYAILPSEVKIHHANRSARALLSPVQGKIEYIDENTGIIVASEIQNYSSKPVTVNYAEKLMVKPKLAKRYLQRQPGDFVYKGEILARRIERNSDGAPPVFVKAPTTGTITDIDVETGIMTIVYKYTPMEFPAHVNGTVTDVDPSRSVQIAYEGTLVEGKIAFGKDCHGDLKLLSSLEGAVLSDLNESIVALTSPPDKQILLQLAGVGVRGVVCYEMDSTQLTDFLGYEPGVINTGNETLPLSILVLNGFGSQKMPSELARLFQKQTACYLNPHTRIRAGVVRPYICI
jgi:uncharacterized protein (TIGR01319 family)